MINKKILFFGRYNDESSIRLLKLLKKKYQTVRVCWSKYKKQKIPEKIFAYKNDCVISYRSYFILNKNILKNTSHAINFHPGPPSFRGIGCANFAIYNGAKKYGITCHLINEKIDNGRIIGSRFFNISKNITLEELLKKTHSEMYKFAKSLIYKLHDIQFIIKCMKLSKKLKWSKKYYNQNNLNELYSINIDSSKDEIKKILRATIYKEFYPFLEFDGKKININKYYEKI